jgi:hypothetical protein
MNKPDVAEYTDAEKTILLRMVEILDERVELSKKLASC